MCEVEEVWKKNLLTLKQICHDDLQLIGNVHYEYNDLFNITTQQLTMTKQSLLICFATFISSYDTLEKWDSENKAIVLKCKGTEKFEFKEMKRRKIEIGEQNIGFLKFKKTKEIEEYFWEYSFSCKIIVIPGVEEKSSIPLVNIENKEIITTREKTPLYPNIQEFEKEIIINDLINENLFFNPIKDDKSSKISIYLNKMNQILNFYNALLQWSFSISDYIQNQIIPKSCLFNETKNEILGKISNLKTNCCPIVKKTDETYELLNKSDQEYLINNYLNNYQEKQKEIKKILENERKYIISYELINIYLSFYQISHNCEIFIKFINYLKEIQIKTLTTTIGKVIKPKDVNKLMKFHFRNKFNSTCAPKKVFYPIYDHLYQNKRINSEGFFTITENNQKPIETFVKQIPANENNKIITNISSSIQISLLGEKFIHGWIENCFSMNEKLNSSSHLSLFATSFPYSEFILLIGRCISKNHISFENAIFLSNKDEIEILLQVESLPTPKEFKKSISSISNEQQEFAKLYRAMQLSESLFVISLIPVQPQLERVLNLPIYATLKIDFLHYKNLILQLLIDHQIPTDILAYNGPDNVEMDDKFNYIIEQYNIIQSMINDEINEKKKLEEFNKLQENNQEAKINKNQINYDFDVDEQDKQILEIEKSLAEIKCIMSDLCCEINEQNCRLDLIESNVESSAFVDTGIEELQRASSNSFSISNLFGKKKPQLDGNSNNSNNNNNNNNNNAPNNSPSLASVNNESDGKENANVSDDNENKNLNQNNNTSSDTKTKEKTKYEDSNLINEPDSFDESLIPFQLDKAFEKYDSNDSLHTATIKATNSWKKSQTLPSDRKITFDLSLDNIKEEKNKVIDLLDSLSRSGNLDLVNTSTHYFFGISNWFDLSLIDTLIVKSENPLTSIELAAELTTNLLNN